jgi:hypothetical protein
MKHRMALHIFTSIARHQIEDFREVVDFAEGNLKAEMKRLGKYVGEKLDGLSDEEQREAADWYADDFYRVDTLYPEIQRRALLTTLMCMTEANLILGCRMCKRAFNLPEEFKPKGRQRTIVQALGYLRAHLTIEEPQITPHWQTTQSLWTIRNALVHNDGKPKASDRDAIMKFLTSNPTIELDHLDRIILKTGSVESAVDTVDHFFAGLIGEINKNQLPHEGVHGRPTPGRGSAAARLTLAPEKR